MPGYVVTKAIGMTCMHGGAASVVPTQTKVLVAGTPVATALSQIAVAGCPFPPSGTPHPCVLIKWVNVSGRVKVMGQAPLLQAPPTGAGNGTGQALDQAPQGPPVVIAVQPRVMAT